MKPFQEGWQNLSDLERLTIWMEQNKKELSKNDLYTEFLENFCISCKNPDHGDYINFQNDITSYEFEDRALLTEGFYAMYNTSLALIILKSIEVVRPELN